jgi:hypothetical protein
MQEAGAMDESWIFSAPPQIKDGDEECMTANTLRMLRPASPPRLLDSPTSAAKDGMELDVETWTGGLGRSQMR